MKRTAVMSAVIIMAFDPKMVQSMMDMINEMPGIADLVGDRMSSATSLLGMLGNGFYGSIAHLH